MIDVSVIMPAYKMEKTICEDVTNVHTTLSKTRWKTEIIVVVDGFVDKTFEEAQKLKLKDVQVIGYKTNKGKGYAVRYGMARAGGRLIAFLDTGMDINPNGISMVLEHMEWYNADVIVGSKRHPASRVLGYSWYRKLYSNGYYILNRFLFGFRVRDTQTGLKVFKREVLEKVLPRLLVKAFAFDVEILAVTRHLGYTRIFEAPVELNWENIPSNFDKLLFLNPRIRQMLIDTFAIFYRLRILRYYDNSNERKWKYDEELQMRVNIG